MHFKKIQDCIFKPERARMNRFCISLLNGSIQDFSDRGASKESNNPLLEVENSIPTERNKTKHKTSSTLCGPIFFNDVPFLETFRPKSSL